MYKSLMTKKFYFYIGTFKKEAKQISPVYLTGIRNWETADAYNYSLVLGTFRIIFSINKSKIGSCNEV